MSNLKNRLQIMLESHELTLQTIIISEVEVENGERTIVKLEEKYIGMQEMKGKLKGKDKYEFEKYSMTAFKHQMDKTKMGVAMRKQEIENQKLSLSILEDMISEEEKRMMYPDKKQEKASTEESNQPAEACDNHDPKQK